MIMEQILQPQTVQIGEFKLKKRLSIWIVDPRMEITKTRKMYAIYQVRVECEKYTYDIHIIIDIIYTFVAM